MKSLAGRALTIVRALVSWLTEHWVAIVGWSELIGGPAAGIWFVIEVRSSPAEGLSGWSLPGALGFCATSGLAGLLLLRGRPSGRTLSIAVQAVQVLRVVVSGVAWRATAGLAAILSFSTPGGWDAILGATATFQAARPSPVTWEVGVNLFSVYALYALLRARAGPAKPDGQSVLATVEGATA